MTTNLEHGTPTIEFKSAGQGLDPQAAALHPLRFRRLYKLLCGNPGKTSRELSDLTDIPLTTIRDVLPRLRNLGLAHSPEWRLQDGGWMAVWHPGAGHNAEVEKIPWDEWLVRRRESSARSKHKMLEKGPDWKRPPSRKSRRPLIETGPFAGLGQR